MRDAVKTVCKQPTKGSKPESRTDLLGFYNEEFAPLLPEGDERPSYENLGNVLDYAAKEITTSFGGPVERERRGFEDGGPRLD